MRFGLSEKFLPHSQSPLTDMYVPRNAASLGTTQPHQPVEALVSRSVSILPPPSDRPFLTVEEAAAVLCIRRTLPTALPVSSSRPAPGCLVSASGVDGSSSHAPRWSAGRTLTLRTRTTQREASNRSACRRHRSRVHRRDPWCCPARMGGPHPPLRITERSQQPSQPSQPHPRRLARNAPDPPSS